MFWGLGLAGILAAVLPLLLLYRAHINILPTTDTADTTTMAAALTAELVPALTQGSTAAIVFLHGLGDSGNGFKDVALHVRRAVPWVQWVLPNAPVRPVTVNNGYRMPAWFDIKVFGGEIDAEDVGRSVSQLEKEIVEPLLREGKRVMVCGFSQGGMLTSYFSVASKHKYAGFAGLSARLTYPKDISSHPDVLAVNRDTPYMHFHGTDDPVVGYREGVAERDALTDPNGIFKRSDYTFKGYEGLQHGVNLDVIEDFTTFVKACLPEQA